MSIRQGNTCNVRVDWRRQRLYEGEREESSREVDGRLYWKGENGYLFYSEAEEVAGQETCLKLQEGRITLIRQGEVNLRQVFAAGTVTQGTYATPYGSFSLQSKTTHCSWELGEELHIHLAYLMSLEGEEQGEFAWWIRATQR